MIKKRKRQTNEEISPQTNSYSEKQVVEVDLLQIVRGQLSLVQIRLHYQCLMLTFEVHLVDKQARGQRDEEVPFDEVLEDEVQVRRDEEQGQERFRPIFH